VTFRIAVRDQGRSRLQPHQRLLRQRLAGFPGVVGVVQPDRNDLRRGDWHQRFDALERGCLLFKGRGTKDVSDQLEQLAVDDFGVKDFVPFLETSYGCHVGDMRNKSALDGAR
jgi:hypothetical protein